MRTPRTIGPAFRCAMAWVVAIASTATTVADEVRVATFNVQNYLCMDRRLDGRFAPGYPKPEAEKAAIRAVLHAVNADVVCLQEIGTQPFLDELQQDLAREGLDYPHAAHLPAADPMRHVAVLSRLPFRAVVRHDDIAFPYFEREEPVKRGLLEVQFASPAGLWRVFVVHLKSPLTEEAADPGAEKRRAAEARALRDRVIRETGDGESLFVIAGDLNAAPNSRTLAGFTRRGERTIAIPLRAGDSRGETWTHRHLASERYERVDYILVSPALARGRVRGDRATIHDGEGALAGSDHRLVWVDLDLTAPLPPTDSTPSAETKTPAGAGPAGVSSVGR